MSINRIASITLIAGAVALAVGTVPGSAARPPASDLSPASVSSAQRLGPELLLSPSPQCDPGDQSRPAVAYNPVHQEYLVAWTNYWPSGDADIYARRVSASGQVLNWFCVTSGLGPGGDGKSRAYPSVAYNAAADEYLMVWMYEASPNVYEIWGRRIPWYGPTTGYSEFRIFAAATNQDLYRPRVAWNSARNEYLVIWNTYNTSLGQYTDVSGCRVSAEGVVQPGAPIAITTSNQPQLADLVHSVDGYMVVWTRNSGATGYDVYGAFLDHNGAKITPPGEFAVYNGPGDQYQPAAAANGENRYMVVWDDDRSGNLDIYGRVFRGDGNPVTEPFALASTTDWEMWPDVAANAANQYLTVWSRDTGSGGSVVARLRAPDGTLAPSVNVFTAPSWQADEAEPDVACGVPGCLIAYARESPSGYYHLYGRLYWPQAVFLPLVLR